MAKIIGIAIFIGVVFKLFYVRTSKRFSMKAVDNLSPRLILDIQTVGGQANVPPNLIAAIVLQESGGDVLAVGKAGERGLMQLTRGAIADVNENFGTNFDFNTMFAQNANLLAGTYYLKLQLRRFKIPANAVRAYNAGETGAKKGRSFDYLFGVQRYA